MPTEPSLSIVIPVRNDAENLRACLTSLAGSRQQSLEIVVVDDASDDDSSRRTVADAREQHGLDCQWEQLEQQSGPAAARNRGVALARAELILFLDADVEVHTDTVSEVLKSFSSDPDLVALFGSYDRRPSGQNLLSQYRNLLHHYTHQNSRRDAFTFWSGCGAIRKEIFIENGGFEDRFHHPSIEDIELGQRLSHQGAKIQLRREVLVRHRKVWRFASMMHCDLFDRGIPWTRELLRLGRIPADMNMRYSDRVLAGIAFLLTLFLGAAVAMEPLWLLAPLWVTLCLIIADRASSPGSGLTRTRWWPLRLVSVAESLGLLLLVAATPQTWPLVAAGSLLFVVVLVLRWEFYRLLSKVRGFAFVFLSFQAHLLFYWICGLAFALGSITHLLRPLEGLQRDPFSEPTKES